MAWKSDQIVSRGKFSSSCFFSIMKILNLYYKLHMFCMLWCQILIRYVLLGICYRIIVYHLYLVITNELLRLEQRSLEAVTLHGPSNFWASRILLIAGVTQSWQASRGSLLAKYLVRSRFAGHRKLTISPKWTHPSLDILRSSYESKIKKLKIMEGFG